MTSAEVTSIPKWKLDLQRRKQKKEEEQQKGDDLDWKNHINDPINVIIIPAVPNKENSVEHEKASKKPASKKNSLDGVSEEHCTSVKNNPFLKFDQIIASKSGYSGWSRYKKKESDSSDSRSKDDTDSGHFKSGLAESKFRSKSVDNLTYKYIQPNQEKAEQQKKASDKSVGHKTALEAIRAKFGKRASTEDVLAIIKPKSPREIQDDRSSDGKKKEVFSFDKHSISNATKGKVPHAASHGTKPLTAVTLQSVQKIDSVQKQPGRQEGSKSLYIKKNEVASSSNLKSQKTNNKPSIPSKCQDFVPSTAIDLPINSELSSAKKGEGKTEHVKKTEIKSASKMEAETSPQRRFKKRLSASELINLNSGSDHSSNPKGNLKRPSSIIDGGEDFFPVFPRAEQKAKENVTSGTDVDLSEDTVMLISVKPLDSSDKLIKAVDLPPKPVLPQSKPTVVDKSISIAPIKKVQKDTKVNIGTKEVQSLVTNDDKKLNNGKKEDNYTFERERLKTSNTNKATPKVKAAQETKLKLVQKKVAPVANLTPLEKVTPVEKITTAEKVKPVEKKTPVNKAPPKKEIISEKKNIPEGNDAQDKKVISERKPLEEKKALPQKKSTTATILKTDILLPTEPHKAVPKKSTENVQSKQLDKSENILSKASSNSLIDTEKKQDEDEPIVNPFAVKLRKTEQPKKGLQLVRKATGVDNNAKRVEKRDPATLLQLQVNGEIPVTNIDDIVLTPSKNQQNGEDVDGRKKKVAIKKAKFDVIGGNAPTGKPSMQTSKSGRNRDKTSLIIRFDVKKITTHEYQSEQSLMEEYEMDDEIQSSPFISLSQSSETDTDEEDDKTKSKIKSNTAMFSEGFQNIRKCDEGEISALLGRGPVPSKPARKLSIEDPPSSPEPEPNFTIKPMDSGNYFSEGNDTALLF